MNSGELTKKISFGYLASLGRRARTVVSTRKMQTLLVLLAAVSIPPFLHACFQPVTFNQNQIEKTNIRYGVERWQSLWSCFLSTYASGLDILRTRPSTTPPHYEDERAMFSYVFSWVSPRATVYPTEGYYYYSFSHPTEGLVCGSIRVADLDDGYLMFNYFKCDGDVPQDVVSIRVEDIEIEKWNDYSYDVVHRGKRVSFELTRPSYFAAEPRDARPADERFVSRVYDESGLRFVLLFNERTTSFYYVLDTEFGVADGLETLDERGFLFAKRSGFVFYRGQPNERHLLVGASFKSIRANDYFDGPGDQVPFRLRLRPLLHLAYPSTLLGDGISESGVLLGQEQWCRYLISAYHEYGTKDEMLRYCDPADFDRKNDLCTALTKEWWHTRAWREAQYRQIEKEGGTIAHRVLDEASRPNTPMAPPQATRKE